MHYAKQAFVATFVLLTYFDKSMGLDSFLETLLSEMDQAALAERQRCNFFQWVATSGREMEDILQRLRVAKAFSRCPAGSTAKMRADGEGNDSVSSKDEEAIKFAYEVLEEYVEKYKKTKGGGEGHACKKRKVYKISGASLIVFVLYFVCALFILIMITMGAIRAYCARRMPMRVTKILDSMRPPDEELSGAATRKTEVPEVPWGSNQKDKRNKIVTPGMPAESGHDGKAGGRRQARPASKDTIAKAIQQKRRKGEAKGERET